MSWYTLTMIALTFVGAATGFAAIKTSRTPQGAVGWVVFLVSFPLLALPAFAFFGRIGFRRYLLERRTFCCDIVNPAYRDAQGQPLARIAALDALTDNIVTPGNQFDLLVDGEMTFPAIFDAIDRAETAIDVQTYIQRDDTLGRDLKARLIAAARRGVTVRFLCDALGSFGLPKSFVAEMVAAGVRWEYIRGPRRPAGRFALNFRNHRKIVIVDGRIGFTGGLNMGEEYRSGGSYGSWRDTHLKMTGPLVAQLSAVFEQDWAWVSGDEPREVELTLPDPETDGALGLVLASGPTDELERGSLFLCGLAGLAQKRLWLATPYFVPHTDFLTALQLAAKRGVDVRLLIPKRPDKWLPWYAARAFYEDLDQVGIEVWEYEPGFMHQKVILVDDDIATVGTMNLDVRSVMLNFEVTVLIEDELFAGEVADMLAEDFARSTRADTNPDREPLRVRILAPLARLFAPIL